MPELPEVALFKRYADATVLLKKITEIWFPDPSLLQAPKTTFTKALEGETFSETRQLGKYLLLKAGPNAWLVFHFGMTGKLEHYQKQEDPAYSSMILCFEDASRLAFVCRRKLGKIFITKGITEFRKERDLGPDALHLGQEEFRNLLQKKKGSVKAAMTDQHVLSGIGNIYADEILHQSRIHPRTKTGKLAPGQHKDLFRQMQDVLQTVIVHEGDPGQFPAGFLLPNRKEGAICPGCGGKVEKTKISGRSTYFCPSCQKEET